MVRLYVGGLTEEIPQDLLADRFKYVSHIRNAYKVYESIEC
jgi:hypothetical protein